MFNTQHWHYLHGRPEATAVLKSTEADFRVTEVLGYEPCGEGEHIYLWVEKTGLNTAFVAEQLAKFSQLPLRAVSYAGRKDKQAVTQQWFGVHKPGKQDIPWSELELPGLTVIKAIRHNKKLRTGVLKGNRFDITLRDLHCPDEGELVARLDSIARHGVPNYFGPQRFGDTRHHPQGGNLALGEKLLQGETIRNRNKRSMAISALRSWLFNEFVSHRIENNTFDSPMSGDTYLLSGSNSFFSETEVTEDLRTRLTQRDLLLSAPMWGKGGLDSQADAQRFETSVAAEHSTLCAELARLGLKQERRAIRLFADNIDWKIADQTLTISFQLPAGCFATSVLREVVQLKSTEDGNENTAE